MIVDSKPEVKQIQDNIINRFMDNSASMQEIDFAVWVLHVVYGWSTDKIRRMKMSSLTRWMKLAPKRMTVGDWIGVNTYFKPREVKKNIWQRIKK